MKSLMPAKEMTLDLGNKVTLKLVQVPAGRFTMGSPETEENRAEDEVQHDVTISKPFYLGIVHVTVDQFAAFVQESGYKTEAEKAGWSYNVVLRDGNIGEKTAGISWRNPGFDQTGDHPAVQVSWNDAKTFCDCLSKKSGKRVRPPTEAEWEYACRAGTKTAYPWGDNPGDGKGLANCADQNLKKNLPNAPADWTFFSWDDHFVFTSPVGSFKANAFGIYDMIGNALEWCSDCYGPYDERPVIDPAGPVRLNDNSSHVLRGGAWSGLVPCCRAAARYYYSSDLRAIGSQGFRVCLDF